MNNKNKDCLYFENLFIDFINKTLSEKDHDFCQKHFNSCTDCKNNEMFADSLFVWQKLDNLPEIKPSKNFMAKLQHQVAVLEEKKRVFWLRIDNLFLLARAPVMSCLFLAITFTTNLSYASNLPAKSKIYTIKNPSPLLEKKFKEISQMSISDIYNNRNRNSTKEK